MSDLRVAFLDAEGTLYVTRRGKKYSDFWNGGEHTIERALEHFMLNKGVRRTLEGLKERGWLLVVVSKHNPELLPDLIRGLGIEAFVDEIIINGDKGKRIAEFLRDSGIPKEYAIMIGDSLEDDIAPAEREGVKAHLVREDGFPSIPELFDPIEEN